MKTTLALLAVTLAGLGFLLGGCRDDSQDFEKIGTIEGKYRATIGINGNGRRVSIGDKDSGRFMYAEDFENDGRLDKLQLIDIPKGSPIEKYASLEAMERVYQEVKNQ